VERVASRLPTLRAVWTVVLSLALLVTLAPRARAAAEDTRLLEAINQAMADDYPANLGEARKKILDALDGYYARESVYPDALADLVKSKDLDAVPNPQIGFGVFEVPRFTYQNFGTNYLLEFSAPRWVQCAYNPPYPDEDGGGSLGAIGDAGKKGAAAPAPADPGAAGETPDAAAGDAGEGANAATPGSWSCPQKPPELW
jgi:hypothetical protein